MIKKQKLGISLIVLVITIIVIIILAGSVILSLADNNPIATASEAKFKTNTEQYKSELGMVISSKYLLDNTFVPESFNVGKWDGTEANKAGTIKEYIKSITPEDAEKFVIQNGKLLYVGSEITEIDYVTDMSIDNGGLEYQLLGVNVIATANSTINGQDKSYSNPIIPKGFKAINDGTKWPTDWNKGLVIEDVNGNQFVWVPVDGQNLIYHTMNDSVISYTLPTGIEYEINQITSYSGFYIARYEAGNESNILVSKKDTTVWNNITHANAKLKAEAMYTSPEIKSGIVTHRQWYTTQNWMENSGTNITEPSWGNHKYSISPANIEGKYGILQKTGFSDYWKANNIYDLAGNTLEFKNEKSGTDYPKVCYTGGSYSRNSGILLWGSISDASYSSNEISFRVVLYII